MSTAEPAKDATEPVKMLDQEEERLREKLKAKSQQQKQRRDSNGDSSSHDGTAKSDSKHSHSSKQHDRRDRRRGDDRDRSRSSSHRGGSPPAPRRSRHYDEPSRSRRDDHHHHHRSRDHGRHGPPPLEPGPYRREYDDRYDNRGGRRDDRGGPRYHERDRPRGGDPYYRAPPPPPVRGNYRDDGKYYDDFGRERAPPPPLPPRSRSRSRSPIRSHRGRSRKRSHSRSSSSSRSSRSSSGSSRSSSSSRSSRSYSSSSSGSSMHSTGSMERESTMTKDQRTVFVNQLVQRATERDLWKYFNAKGFRVNEVILLRDKRTGKHKGCAYVELRKLEHVQPCIAALNDQAPDFQKFPIIIKASEAEKNYAAATTTTSVTTTAVAANNNVKVASLSTPIFPLDAFGNPIMSQKVYVGGLNPTVTHDHLLALFSPFGSLVSVQMQVDAITQTSKGFAFLQFVDPRDANLAIQSMTGQSLAGQALKTGWGNQQGGGNIVTSEEFPPDAATKTQAAYGILKQLNLGQAVAAVVPASTTVSSGGGPGRATVTASVPQPGTVAAARASLAAAANVAQPAAAAPALLTPSVTLQSAAVGAPVLAANANVQAAAVSVPLGDASAKQIGNADHPSRHILIHNMFDKDQETEPGWEKEIKEEFESEATKFGVLERCVVMSKEPGGKIYASFSLMEGAKTCASTLAGRWFDRRQLRVEFVAEDDVPKSE